ncbi:MAG: excinuclease ABC subunit A, partial [Bacteroidetes bacterium]
MSKSTPTTAEPALKLKDAIYIKGARANNLKNISLDIPKNKLVVVTGVSGSGKSSITMDTLFAEGQRRYVESLSSYARQFLMRMKKPDVDYIKGICPAIAIEQKVSTANARSTVGTLTEIYDYLRLLYARVGRTYSPISGREVKKHQVSDVVDFIMSLPEGTKVQLFAYVPTKYRDRSLGAELQLLLQKGYTRVWWDNKLQDIQELMESGHENLEKALHTFAEPLRILVDRFVVKAADEENTKRIADSVQTTFYESEGDCEVAVIGGDTTYFNNRFELDGLTFLEPNPQLFNFNNPYGACPKCEGFSMVMGIDERKVVPDPSLSVYEGAISCWKGERYGRWLDAFLRVAHRFDFPVHTPYQDLNEDERRLLWQGNEFFAGIHAFFEDLREK